MNVSVYESDLKKSRLGTSMETKYQVPPKNEE